MRLGDREPALYQVSEAASSQVKVAEDARFELARGCPQHAFQVCASAFMAGRVRL